MHLAPLACPICSSPTTIARLECASCATSIEGRFTLGALGRLSRDQLEFVEVFLRCRGKIKDVEQELGVSYPTVVGRLDQVVASLEGAPAPPRADDGRRDRQKAVLDALASGEIDAAEAATRLRALKKE